MTSVTIKKIENGYLVTWDAPLTTRYEYRPKVSKALFEQIKRFMEN